jgi:hypothetical protein
MENLNGRVLHNGIVVAENVDISLIHIPPSPGVLGEWYGTHNAPDLFELDRCILELEDGRTGEIIFTSNSEFKGSGPIK